MRAKLSARWLTVYHYEYGPAPVEKYPVYLPCIEAHYLLERLNKLSGKYAEEV